MKYTNEFILSSLSVSPSTVMQTDVDLGFNHINSKGRPKNVSRIRGNFGMALGWVVGNIGFSSITPVTFTFGGHHHSNRFFLPTIMIKRV